MQTVRDFPIVLGVYGNFVGVIIPAAWRVCNGVAVVIVAFGLVFGNCAFGAKNMVRIVDAKFYIVSCVGHKIEVGGGRHVQNF